ncbi:MAG: excinuclease ABC subunit UvrA [Planctomycetota bacterium]|nr:excinuclease ABC subunit UvrA [Planctomycetota bacterium]
MTDRVISLRKVAVHNLKQVDLDLPHQRLIVFCGVSGSGKSSLALDTLYAEGQRRYIESFSPYTRQFLERLDKPDAESITGLPPAIAVTHKNVSRSGRSTVGTTTEINDYLRLLFAKQGRVTCARCQTKVRRDSPASVAELLLRLPDGARYIVAAPLQLTTQMDCADQIAAQLKEQGYLRVIVSGRTVRLDEGEPGELLSGASELLVVIDRLTAGSTTPQRIRDSLESAFRVGEGASAVLLDSEKAPESWSAGQGRAANLDDRTWWEVRFSDRMQCGTCGTLYIEPEPRLFSFNSPLGACPECEGFGTRSEIDMELVVPDPKKTLREGAIAPWRTPAYVHELEELIALAGDYDLPLDVPYRKLTEAQRRIVIEGVPERKFGGLTGFFAWLERKKYKMHIRVFQKRWRKQQPCSACNGTRLRPEALAVQVAGLNFPAVLAKKIEDCLAFLQELPDSSETSAAESIAAANGAASNGAVSNGSVPIAGRLALTQLRSRLGFLCSVGLGYLTLDRALKTLSGGELARVTLTATLGSSLVQMLYVLDEPSVGLHPADVDRLVQAIVSLRDRGNSVVVVEHEETLIRAADQIVEVGPGAGERGGQIVFQGTPQEIEQCTTSVTGDFLAGRRGVTGPRTRRTPTHGWIRLSGASGNNLQNLTVDFPLGLLCVVSGVSGAGKSTLVDETLYPALLQRKRMEGPRPLTFSDVIGDSQVEDVMLVDQSPIGRSPRSNPVTYIKAFDEIRAVFADTLEARTHNFTAGQFSFNVDGGRCTQCEGDGYLQIDMQFLADVFMKCPSCQGKRYRKEILKVHYRGRSIADVLEMTVREAFAFFRGLPKVQARLKQLIDVGLDYLRLGQPANTLSGGEAQRLKLAAYMSSAKRSRTLFILDEPTTGLHFADVTQLLDCFEGLLSVGHSLIVVEHNLQLMKSADYIIDLGPGAAEQGGQIVAAGTPEEVAQNPQSATGRLLAATFARERELMAGI